MSKKRNDEYIRRMTGLMLESTDVGDLSDKEIDEIMNSGFITADRLKGSSKYKPRDHSMEYSREELRETLSNFGPRRAVGYVRKVLNNPDSNPGTKRNIRSIIESEPHLLGHIDLENPGRISRKVPSLYVDDRTFEAMGPRKRFYFGRLRTIGDKDLNCRYGLKVMTSPTSSGDDKKAITELTNEFGQELFGTKRRFFRRSVS